MKGKREYTQILLLIADIRANKVLSGLARETVAAIITNMASENKIKDTRDLKEAFEWRQAEKGFDFWSTVHRAITQ